MLSSAAAPQSGAPVRVIIAGEFRGMLPQAADALTDAIAERADVVHLPLAAGWKRLLTARPAVERALRDTAAEVIHCADPRLVPAAVAACRRRRAAITVTLGEDEPVSPGLRRLLPHVDEVFVHGPRALRRLRDLAPCACATAVSPVAAPLPWPSRRSMARLRRALRGVAAGRLTVAVPWPRDRAELRLLRDYMLPQLETHPVCLLLGAPGRHEARMLFGPALLRHDVRAVTGGLDAGLIAATARCVDAFLLLSDEPATSTGGELAIALAMGGVPLVMAGAEDVRVLAHEQSAFLLSPGDHDGLVQALNQVLALPALQRHWLGEEFARHTLLTHRPETAAAIYAERFAAVAGRPAIPAEWRIAA